MKYLIYFLLIVVLSCQRENNQSIKDYKIHYKDTSQVKASIIAKDTIYRYLKKEYYRKYPIEKGDVIIYYDETFEQKSGLLQIDNYKLNGKEQYWSIDGRIQVENLYVNDTILNSKEYFKNGNIWLEYEFINGKPQKRIINYENGNSKWISYYKSTNEFDPEITIEFDTNGVYKTTLKHFKLELELVKDNEWTNYLTEVSIDSLEYEFSDKYKEELRKEFLEN